MCAGVCAVSGGWVGVRGCFVGLQANQSFTPAEALAALTAGPLAPSSTGPGLAALHFGYPHLMAGFQGPALHAFLSQAQAQAQGSLLLSVDLNGVQSDSPADVLEAALPLVDVLHLNEAEAQVITQQHSSLSASDPTGLSRAAAYLHDRGVAVVALTLGEQGAYVSVTPQQARLDGSPALGRQAGRWAGESVLLPPAPVTEGAQVNTNGAGDAFIAGLVAALLVRTEVATLSLAQATRLALLSARQRVDSVRRAAPHKASFSDMLQQVLTTTTQA